MLNDIKKQFIDQYPRGCAEELEKTEAILTFPKFDSQDAWVLGNTLVKNAKKFNKGICVLIIREVDQLAIFQYVDDDKSQRNIDFALGKRNTVIKTGHCSLWAMAKELTDGGLDEIFSDSSDCLPAGGSFPIKVKDKLVATISVSGLQEGNDHKLVVDSLCDFLNEKVPKFSGKLI